MLRVVFSNCLIWLAPMVLLAGLINSVPVPPASPCPGLFSYQYDSNRSEYYGLANLQSQQIKNTVEVEMSFSIAAQLPSVSRSSFIEFIPLWGCCGNKTPRQMASTEDYRSDAASRLSKRSHYMKSSRRPRNRTGSPAITPHDLISSNKSL